MVGVWKLPAPLDRGLRPVCHEADSAGKGHWLLTLPDGVEDAGIEDQLFVEKSGLLPELATPKCGRPVGLRGLRRARSAARRRFMSARTGQGLFVHTGLGCAMKLISAPSGTGIFVDF